MLAQSVATGPGAVLPDGSLEPEPAPSPGRLWAICGTVDELWDRVATDISLKTKVMTITRIALLCTSLASAITMVGCSALRQSSRTENIPATNGPPSAGLYDETVHYNAVKNLWFGLDDPTAGQDKSAP
jgi:hypothetical protein